MHGISDIWDITFNMSYENINTEKNQFKVFICKNISLNF